MAPNIQTAYWAEEIDGLIARLESSSEGLTSNNAMLRLRSYGANNVGDDRGVEPLKLFVRQFESPLVMVLIFGAALSFILRQWTDAGIILAIVAVSTRPSAGTRFPADS